MCKKSNKFIFYVFKFISCVQTMKILSILLAITLQFSAWSQDWMESYKDASCLIEYSKITYEDPSYGMNHERLVFRYVNLTSQEITIDFDRKIAYDGVDLSNSQERTFTIVIPGNSTMEYSDEVKNNKLYYVFISDNKGTIKRKLQGLN